MEVAISRRQTEGPARNPPINPRHEPRQPVLGALADPRRTAQARHRRGSTLGHQIYGETQETPVARVEDLPAQPRRRDCRNGSLCRSDPFLSAALWFADSLARPAPDPMAGSDGPSNGRMDGPASPSACRARRGDLAAGHSLIEALRDNDCCRLFLIEWKSATERTKLRTIDSY